MFSIPLDQRCDGLLQCSDSSDEIGCERILLPTGYLKALPPPPSKIYGFKAIVRFLKLFLNNTIFRKN